MLDRWLWWSSLILALAVGMVLALAEGDVPPPVSGSLRIATWNLENFPHPGQDPDRMARALAVLRPDLVAFQEVREPTDLATLVPDMTVVATQAGGRGGQRLAVAFDPSRLSAVGPGRQDDRLAPDGRLRPALVVRLRDLRSGRHLRVVVVHLKAGGRGLEQRRAQWEVLRRIVQETGAEPTVLLGDFNTAVPGERAELAKVLATADLREAVVEEGCTAYWGGPRFDDWREPSALDGIWISRHVGVFRSHAAGPCRRHACRAVRSSDAYPEVDLWRASDHCPLWVDVPVAPAVAR